MKIAVLGDIHGNWTALQAVETNLTNEGSDVLIGLGDYLFTSLGSAKVVDWLKSQSHCYYVQGDNDSWDCYHRFKSRAAHDPIDDYEYVARLPSRIVLDISGYRILVQHGYAYEPMEQHGWNNDTIRTAVTRPYVESVVDLRGIDIALFGDIHKPSIDAESDVLIIHPGSVGVPVDRTPWQAKYVILDLREDMVTVRPRTAAYSRDHAVLDVRRAHKSDPGADNGFARLLAGGTPDHDWEPMQNDVVWRRNPTANP